MFGQTKAALTSAAGFVLLHAHQRIRSPKLRKRLASQIKYSRDPFFLTSGSESYVIHTHDKYLGPTVYAEGSFEFGKVEDAIGLLPRRPEVFVNVGANIGTTCIPAVKRGFADRAVAVEPDPANCRLLRANIALNGLHDRIVVHEAALGAEDGWLELEQAGENTGDHRIRITAEPGAYNEETRNVVRVRSATLDTICPKGDDCILWMDTQGYEGFVLAGGPAVLANRPPLVLEFWPYGLARAQSFGLLKAALASYTQFTDLRFPTLRRPISDLDALFSEFPTQHGHTDILLFD